MHAVRSILGDDCVVINRSLVLSSPGAADQVRSCSCGAACVCSAVRAASDFFWGCVKHRGVANHPSHTHLHMPLPPHYYSYYCCYYYYYCCYYYYYCYRPHPQAWHSDGPHLSATADLPCHCLNVFVPLVDVTACNGPTEIRPGSVSMTRNLKVEMLKAMVGKRYALAAMQRGVCAWGLARLVGVNTVQYVLCAACTIPTDPPIHLCQPPPPRPAHPCMADCALSPAPPCAAALCSCSTTACCTAAPATPPRKRGLCWCSHSPSRITRTRSTSREIACSTR